jgi:hypothetical protein
MNKGESMTELELTRTRGDRRLYALEGIGTVRLEGMFARSASAEASGRSWRFSRRGFWQRVMEATDAAGALEGEFVPRDIRRGGTLRWGGRELTLHPVSSLRERYALSEGDRDLVLLDGKGWGRRPVKITLAETDAVEPGLLLFTAFVVHQLAVNAASAASASTTAALSGTYSGG